jgi:hypothetical protein
VKLAAISYDSEEILKFFADRRNIEYPLLGVPAISSSTRKASSEKNSSRQNTGSGLLEIA